MSNIELAKQNSEIIQKLVLDGDLSKMSQQQKVIYYNQFCESLGLNPLTQPFQLIKFQGKERLYAAKDCTEQLRKIHGVSITDISTTSINDVFIVTAKALDKQGKTDCSSGAVNIKGLTGDNLANALMKAETKAKRRVTLSICGLGILDETETDTMKGATVAALKTEEVKGDAYSIVTETSDINKEETKPEPIPGHWFAKLEKCKAPEDVDTLGSSNKETINANPELRKLFVKRRNELKQPDMTYGLAKGYNYDVD